MREDRTVAEFPWVIRSGQKDFADEVGVIVLEPLGNQLAFEAQVKMVTLYVAPPVHRNRVARGLDRDLRALADDAPELHLESVREQRVEPFGFRPREGRLATHRRELFHRGYHLEPEIFGDKLFENSRVRMVEIFEKPDCPLPVFSRSHRLSPSSSRSIRARYERDPARSAALSLTDCRP